MKTTPESGTEAPRGWRRALPLRLRHPLPLVFAVIMAAVALAIYVLMTQSHKRLIEHEAVKIAEIVAGNALKHRVRSIPRKWPTSSPRTAPAQRRTFTRARIRSDSSSIPEIRRTRIERSGEGLYKYHPLSKWNIEPTQGLSDEFQRWAWRELEAQDLPVPAAPIRWKPIWKFEAHSEGSVLRYMRADPAAKPACVNCHNENEQKPESPNCAPRQAPQPANNGSNINCSVPLRYRCR